MKDIDRKASTKSKKTDNLNLNEINERDEEDSLNYSQNMSSMLGSSTHNTTKNNDTQVDSNGYQTTVSEEQINEIAVLASKENLDLGCKLIE